MERPNAQNQSKRTGFGILSLVKSLATSYIISGILILTAALALTYTGLSESYIKIIVNAIVGISSFLGGFALSRKRMSQGLINGLICGVFYIGSLYLVGSLFRNSFSVSTAYIITAVISIIFGVIGGIFGINPNARASSR
jgi:putative membrane protein (TIGR04086 family)